MDNFDEIYSKLINENYYELEKMRKSIIKSYVYFIILFVVTIIVFLSIFFMLFSVKITIPSLIPIFAIIVISTFFVILMLKSKDKVNFLDKYKKCVILPLIQYVLPNSNYESNNFIDKDVYAKCSFNENYSIYAGDDYVDTKIHMGEKEFSLVFSEIRTEIKTRDSDGDTHYSLVFQGIAGYIDYPLNIDCNIEIKRNSVFKAKNTVEMDSSEFEKYFDVECDNQILAMQFLTSDTMTQFVNFLKDKKLFFEANVIANDKIYFRFFSYPFSNTMFEPSLFKNSLDKYVLKRYFEILTCIKSFSNIVHASIEDIN